MTARMCGFASRLLALVAILCAAPTVVFAQEGLLVGDPRHKPAKFVIQNTEAWKEEYKSAIETLRKLIAEFEARGGPQSPEVGVLLLDIGEATVKRAEFAPSEKKDVLRRAVRALEAGEKLVQRLEQHYEGATVARSRGMFYRGVALKGLEDAKGAETALREGVSVHWRRYNDNPAQLKFFEPLYEVTPPGPTKVKTAELWLKLSKQFGQPTETPAAMLEAARDLVPATLKAAAETRAKAEKLAEAGDADGAYAVIAKKFDGATSSARRVFTARLKPSIFFIYDDPLARSSTGWTQERKPLSAYDKVATRYFVDAQLQPFIAEGRNALMDLIGRLDATYETGDRASARLLCRLLPPHYSGYDGPGLPSTCSYAVHWAGWFQSMGDVEGARDVLRMALDLAGDDLATDAAATRRETRTDLALTEARYASPDEFLTTLDALESEDASAVPTALRFYAGVLRDDPGEAEAALRQAGGIGKLSETLVADAEERGSRDPGEALQDRLGVTGERVAALLCKADIPDLPPVARRVQCLRAGRETAREALKAPPLAADVADGPAVTIAAAPELVQAVQGPAAVKLAAAMAGGPGAEDMTGPLSKDAQQIVARLAKAEDVSPQDRAESGAIALALLKKGRLDLARDWAKDAYVSSQIASGGATIWSLWLLEGFREKRFRDGWAYLAAGHPLFAEAAFADFTPDRPTYQEQGQAPAEEDRSEFDWTRTIGALHGRMLARVALGDQPSALKDARALVDYSAKALARQSFSRFETRELVARVASPALAAAARFLVGEAGPLERGQKKDDFDKVFLALQLMKPSTTATTVTRLAARLSTGSPELAAQARKREELRQRWDTARLGAATGKDEQAAEVRRLGDELSRLDAEISKAFPAYVELAGTSAVAADRTQAALGGERSLISVSTAGEDLYVVGLSSEAGRIVRLEGGLEALAANADAVRKSMEPRGGRFAFFRAEEGRSIYRQILAPVWDVATSGGQRTLIGVTDGPLDGLPFGALPTEQDGRFVIDDIADARLPSVSSLVLLASISGARAPAKPFLGVGDPLLEGDPAKRRGVEQADVFAAVGGGVDLARLRDLPRLPETADEISKLSELFGAGSEVALRGDATEANIRGRPLADYQILAFATHGLVAGEFSGLSEPGLVMSPPASITADDDGYLSASEIGALDLSAEMVLLSACNTAAADGAQGAEGLSGLSKAFFFAGAQSLLVSHWSVLSDAAVSLTTGMIEARKSGAAPSYPLALRASILKFRQASQGEFGSHPGFWGPFQVVGG